MPVFTDERRTLDSVKNHGEFRAALLTLAMNADLGVLDLHVHAVAKKWFLLAREHQAEASAADPITSPRMVYSRAYYAAYNASKAVRYVVRGQVSLRGDDHRKVADLPDRFPDVEAWSAKLPVLYEHRLRADYDNWTNSTAENTCSAAQCLGDATEFLAVAAGFLLSEYGLNV